jgi:predicted nucleic acid-binding Zn ribbon protein
LQRTVEGQRVHRTNGAVRLGEVAQQLMAEQISPRQEKFSSVAEVWNLMLPAELAQHCEIVGVSGGQLKVQVDSPSYMYELQLCSSQLLEELQQQCPKARLTKIKFIVA